MVRWVFYSKFDSMNAKGLFVKYSLEFFVIVLGITVSFWLNQLAVERSNENERIKVLQSLHSELAEIEIYCNERTDNYRDDIDILKALLLEDLNIESLNSLTSSKARIEFVMTFYRVFEPPMNQYQSIIHAGALKYIKSEKVNEKLGLLHNTFQRYMHTSVNYEQELKKSFLPYLIEAHPELLLAKENNSIDLSGYAQLLHSAITTDPRFEANLRLLLGYLKNKLYFLKLYNGIQIELNAAVEEALGPNVSYQSVPGA